MTTLLSRLLSGANAFLGAFREQSVTSSLENSSEFNSSDARRLRYAMYRAGYENTSYRNIHDWAQGRRVRYGLGKYIRDIHNPTAQLVNFHVSTIWGGSIAPMLMGGAIPLLVGGKSDDAKVRTAADTLMRVSNFGIQKNIAVLKGCNLGDVGIKIIDDPARGQSRLEVIDPSTIDEIILDNGIIKAYRLTEWRVNENNIITKYSETCERGDNDDVIFRTFIGDRPSIWPGMEVSEWVEPYGFIPFVTIQHNNVGGTWGWAEAHPVIGKIMEMDDQASMLDDYLRRAYNSLGLISGMDNPAEKKTARTSTATADNMYPGREEEKYLWAGKDSSASYTPMISGLDIANADARIDKIMAAIESDLPELRKSIWDISGDPSGIALATAREPVEKKIKDRRGNYDTNLVRAMQMAIVIGGWRKYKGFEGFDLQSYERGLLDMSIANRPVFDESAGERIARNNTFWTTWAQVSTAGNVSFEEFARSYGWTDDQLKAHGTQLAASILESQQDVIPTEAM